MSLLPISLLLVWFSFQEAETNIVKPKDRCWNTSKPNPDQDDVRVSVPLLLFVLLLSQAKEKKSIRGNQIKSFSVCVCVTKKKTCTKHCTGNQLGESFYKMLFKRLHVIHN